MQLFSGLPGRRWDAAAVLRLYDDANLWQKLSERGQQHIRRHFSEDAARAMIRELLDALPAR